MTKNLKISYIFAKILSVFHFPCFSLFKLISLQFFNSKGGGMALPRKFWKFAPVLLLKLFLFLLCRPLNAMS